MHPGIDADTVTDCRTDFEMEHNLIEYRILEMQYL